jgi:biopolymer transport protein ExbB/TolQ
MELQELLAYIRLGGITMAVIIAGSVLAVAVAIERIIALWGVSEQARGLGEAVSKHLLRGDLAAARSTAERSDALAADLFLAGLGRAERPQSAGLEAAVERERAQLGLKLKRNLWVLGTIGATAPFVGLFGTVAGIMQSFRDLGLDVQAGGTGGTAAVMTGISEALVVTAAGILVAVEAVVLYNYFQSRLGRVMVELRLVSEELVELIRERPAPGAEPVPAAARAAAAEGT